MTNQLALVLPCFSAILLLHLLNMEDLFMRLFIYLLFTYYFAGYTLEGKQELFHNGCQAFFGDPVLA